MSLKKCKLWVVNKFKIMSTLQIRIDKETKVLAKEIFESLGLDMSSGIKMYLRQVVINKGIPFPVLTENGFTLEEEKEILKAAKEAREGKNVLN